jgi:ComF family protein
VNIKNIKNFLIDIVFPRKCLGCLDFIDSKNDSFVCHACLSTTSMQGSFVCAFCLSPVVLGKTCPFCCKEKNLDRLFVATSYEEPLVEKMVITMKYKFVKGLANDNGQLMANYFNKKIQPNVNIDDLVVLVPVPLHRRRFNWRGFNQSEIIAQKIGNELTMVVAPVLVRKTNTRPQAEIKERVERIKNSRGVFKCLNPEKVSGKTILLIDDVSTTGSTLEECAGALKGAGAKAVFGFVFARGNM